METEVTKKLFTVREYHRMGEAGILRPEDRVELIDREIIEMSPIGYRHALCVNRASTLFIQAFENRGNLSPQNPRYAAASISEYWIEDLQHDLLYVYRDPAGETYNTILTFHPGDSVAPLAFPEINFRVEELLSTDCDASIDAS